MPRCLLQAVIRTRVIEQVAWPQTWSGEGVFLARAVLAVAPAAPQCSHHQAWPPRGRVRVRSTFRAALAWRRTRTSTQTDSCQWTKHLTMLTKTSSSVSNLIGYIFRSSILVNDKEVMLNYACFFFKITSHYACLILNISPLLVFL